MKRIAVLVWLLMLVAGSAGAQIVRNAASGQTPEDSLNPIHIQLWDSAGYNVVAIDTTLDSAYIIVYSPNGDSVYGDNFALDVSSEAGKVEISRRYGSVVEATYTDQISNLDGVVARNGTYSYIVVARDSSLKLSNPPFGIRGTFQVYTSTTTTFANSVDSSGLKSSWNAPFGTSFVAGSMGDSLNNWNPTWVNSAATRSLLALPAVAPEAGGGLPTIDVASSTAGSLIILSPGVVASKIYAVNAGAIDSAGLGLATTAGTAASAIGWAVLNKPFAADYTAGSMGDSLSNPTYVTNNDSVYVKTASIDSNTFATSGKVGLADWIWDDDTTGHYTSPNMGWAASQTGAGSTPPTAAEISDSVWKKKTNVPTGGTYPSGSFATALSLDSSNIKAILDSVNTYDTQGINADVTQWRNVAPLAPTTDGSIIADLDSVSAAGGDGSLDGMGLAKMMSDSVRDVIGDTFNVVSGAVVAASVAGLGDTLRDVFGDSLRKAIGDSLTALKYKLTGFPDSVRDIVGDTLTVLKYKLTGFPDSTRDIFGDSLRKALGDTLTSLKYKLVGFPDSVRDIFGDSLRKALGDSLTVIKYKLTGFPDSLRDIFGDTLTVLKYKLTGFPDSLRDIFGDTITVFKYNLLGFADSTRDVFGDSLQSIRKIVNDSNLARYVVRTDYTGATASTDSGLVARIMKRMFGIKGGAADTDTLTVAQRTVSPGGVNVTSIDGDSIPANRLADAFDADTNSIVIAASLSRDVRGSVIKSPPDSIRNRLADDTTIARMVIASYKRSLPDSLRNRLADDTTLARIVIASYERSLPDSLRNRIADDTTWARVVIASYKRSLPDSVRNRLADDTTLARIVIAYAKRSAPDSVWARLVDLTWDEDSTGHYTTPNMAFVASQTGASTGADSGVVARIVGRKGWGIAAGTAGSSDSTPVAQRTVTGGGTGTGAIACSLYVKTGATAISGARVFIYNSALTSLLYQNANAGSGVTGLSTFGLDPATTYKILAAKTGYSYDSLTSYQTILTGASGKLIDTIPMTAISVGAPASASVCRVFGWVYDASGEPVDSATVNLRLTITNENVVVLDTASGVHVADYGQATLTDSTGYFYLDRIPNVLLWPANTKYEYSVIKAGQIVRMKRNVTVPNEATKIIDEMIR